MAHTLEIRLYLRNCPWLLLSHGLNYQKENITFSSHFSTHEMSIQFSLRDEEIQFSLLPSHLGKDRRKLLKCACSTKMNKFINKQQRILSRPPWISMACPYPRRD